MKKVLHPERFPRKGSITFRGFVEAGRGLGRSFNFPTINIHLSSPLEISHGVYRTRVFVDKNRFLGAMHYGPRETLNEKKPVVEIYLLDFEGDLYGKEVKIEVLEKIRDIQKFSSLEALKHAISQDVAEVRKRMLG